MRYNKGIISMLLVGAVSFSGIAHAQENTNTTTEQEQSVESTQESTTEQEPNRVIINDEGRKLFFKEHHTPGATYKNGILTVQQGTGVYTEGGLCSIGYFDNKNKRMLIAAHCIREKLGKSMYVVDQNFQARKIATAPLEHHHNRDLHRDDWAWVDLEKNVVGVNGYSGDTMVPPTEVSPGDQACSIGVNDPVVKCGVVKNVDENVILLNRAAGGIPGDSGGPAWIPGKGFIGVYSLLVGAPDSHKNYTYSAFTYPKLSENDQKIKVNSGKISFPAMKMMEPSKATTVVANPSGTVVPTPASTTTTKKATTSTSSKVTTSKTTSTSRSTSAKTTPKPTSTTKTSTSTSRSTSTKTTPTTKTTTRTTTSKPTPTTTKTTTAKPTSTTKKSDSSSVASIAVPVVIIGTLVAIGIGLWNGINKYFRR